jgi:hypothetical protein
VLPNQTTWRAFGRSVLQYARNDFIHGTLTARLVFLLRAVTWPLRALLRRRMFRRDDPGTAFVAASDGKDKRLNIAIWTGGGLGDLVSTTGYLERLFVEHGRPNIDVYSDRRSYLSFVFNNAPYVRRLLPNYFFLQFRGGYDVVIHVHRTASYEVLRPDRVAAMSPSLAWCVQTSSRTNDKEFWAHIREMPYLDGDLAKRAVFKGLNRKSLLGYSGAVNFGRDDWIYLCPDINALSIFKKTGLSPFRYITIHDGYDTNVTSGCRSTKQWSERNWRALVSEFKAKHPELMIVQIGGSNSEPIDGIDVNLIDKANFHHAAWLLKYAACHVDNESGLVRLAREMGGRAVVIFGPTDPNFFGFTENVNLHPHVCGNCFWSTRDWLTRCPRGLKTPECTDSVQVTEVLDGIEHVLAARNSGKLAVLDAEVIAKRSTPQSPAMLSATPRNHVVCTEAPKQWEYSYAKRMIIEHVGRHDNIKIATVGCVHQTLARYLAMSGVHVVCFDPECFAISRELDYLEKRELETRTGDGLEMRCGSIFSVPCASESFDAVICALVEEGAFEGFAIREALRILKPGGALVLTFAITNSVRISAFLGELKIDSGQVQMVNNQLERSVSGMQELASHTTSGGITIRKSR